VPLHAIVQHSFGLPLTEAAQPFRGHSVLSRVTERFDHELFSAHRVGPKLELEDQHFAHSPLAQRGLTTLDALTPTFIGPFSSVEPLPDALGWASTTAGRREDRYEEPSLILADKFDPPHKPSFNDFLVTKHLVPDDREPISQLLLELMAHKRSRLFGFRLANRFVNVLLPHAELYPVGQRATRAGRKKAWFVQPLVSFIRGGHDRDRLRPTYALTFFLIPAMAGEGFARRPTSATEIGKVLDAGWGFAAAPPENTLARFDLGGELFEYLSPAARLDLLGEGRDAKRGLELRRVVELAAFGVGLVLAQGRSSKATSKTKALIGNEVVAALGSARVSSVVVRDDALKAKEVRRPINPKAFPQPLLSLMEGLSDPIRAPQAADPLARTYRLDRPFVDDDLYATGVLPVKRCLVVSSGRAQYGIRESALMQAGSIAYMTIGAATAIGTMRTIDRRLEYLDVADPTRIAAIDSEIAADLGEIYDLDIVRESYREVYRRLRNSLGITRDYALLQDKMQALYRATSTLHEDKAQRQIAWLTAAIVILSVFILFGTLILIGKPGG
jgi:hypothetical protein